jgi:hypothetical protein
MPKVRLKTPVRDAWQCLRWDDMPNWVNSNVERREDGLYLKRRSGLQRIETGDWLVQELDGYLEWMTDAEMRSNYEEVT